MTTMIAELYDALKEAGASEEKAIAAAKSIADYENHFVLIESKIDRFKTDLESKSDRLKIDLESKIDRLKTDLESEIKIVKTEFGVIKWLLGFLMAGIVSLIVKAFM